MEYAHFSPDAAMKKLCEMWDGLSNSDRTRLHLSDLCAAAGVEPEVFLGRTMEVVARQNGPVAAMLAAVAHPEIVAKTVKFAKQKSGVADRKFLHEHSGFIPVPKGTTIINRFQQLNQTNTLAAPTPDSHELPAFEQDAVMFGKSERGELLLEASCKDND